MAYSFVRASSQYIQATSSPITDIPITLFARAYSGNTTNNQALLSLCAATGLNAHWINYSGAEPGDPAVSVSYGTGIGVASTSSAYSTNTWQALVGRFISDTSRNVTLDAFTGTNATSAPVTEASIDRLQIACVTLSGAVQNAFDGRLAETAIWTENLNDDEVASLTKGFKPTRIRPQSLVFYAPLVRNLQDTRGGLALTNNNSATVADHPRVY